MRARSTTARKTTISRVRGLALACLAAALFASSAACSSHGGTAPAPTLGSSTTPSNSATPGSTAPSSAAPSSAAPTGNSTPTSSQTAGRTATRVPSSPSSLPSGVSTAKPKDPLATGAVQQVSRHGKTPHPTIDTTTSEQTFTKPVTYTDGLRIKVTKVTQGVMTGHGPGVYPGRPTTTFTLALTNGTSAPLTIGVVVVTVTYGSPARVAHHVYDDRSVDFGGVVKPGASTEGVYGFSIPAAGRGDVTMTVDIDGRHHLAIFHGSVK